MPETRPRRVSQFGKFYLMTATPPLWTLEFDFFPSRFSQIGRVNWEPQDVFSGVKPLAYGNREPQVITVETVLDKTDAAESISPDIDRLFLLQKEVSIYERYTANEIQVRTFTTRDGTRVINANSMPPTILACWGDRVERVVLVELEVTTEFCLPDGSPVRARVRLSLTEIQDEITSVSSRVLDDGGDLATDPTVTTGQASGRLRVGPIP